MVKPRNVRLRQATKWMARVPRADHRHTGGDDFDVGATLERQVHLLPVGRRAAIDAGGNDYAGFSAATASATSCLNSAIDRGPATSARSPLQTIALQAMRNRVSQRHKRHHGGSSRMML